MTVSTQWNTATSKLPDQTQLAMDDPDVAFLAEKGKSDPRMENLARLMSLEIGFLKNGTAKEIDRLTDRIGEAEKAVGILPVTALPPASISEQVKTIFQTAWARVNGGMAKLEEEKQAYQDYMASINNLRSHHNTDPTLTKSLRNPDGTTEDRPQEVLSLLKEYASYLQPELPSEKAILARTAALRVTPA